MNKKIVIAIISSLLVGSIIGAGAVSLHKKNHTDSLFWNDFNDPFYNSINSHFSKIYKEMQEIQEDMMEGVEKELVKVDFYNDQGGYSLINKDEKNSCYLLELRLPDGVDIKNIESKIDEHTIKVSLNWDEEMKDENSYNSYSGAFKRVFRCDEELDFKNVVKEQQGNKLLIKIPYKSR